MSEIAQFPREGKLESSLSPQVEREILRALQSLNFGSVEITVHDSKIVQIERKEKVRFN